VEDRVDLADVGEELVAEPLALARAAHDARDVDDADHRGDDLLALDVLEDLLEVLVGTGTTPTFGSIVQNG
jgi:hypothetical protein